ncbi:hypothetical protein IFM89_037064 [Coptis chinensis]|uniref:Mitochondrial transcription termination factor family protein n=1 Tax=Coptis chinensis TaxID=261450 RepID=A0A835LQD6_9MAGN|nr:hypothetical protein IFM89_037064 [Coptis chinensis]
MLGKSLTSPVLTFQSAATRCYVSPLDIATSTPNATKLKVSQEIRPSFQTDETRRRACLFVSSPRKWNLCSTAQTQAVTLGDEERKTWEACREALVAFEFNVEEIDKMLGKAFGHVHSPYWGEARAKEVPKLEVVNETLDYLRSLGLSDNDLGKLLKKFPEVLGCSLDEELRNNVQVLADTWGIKGKTLRSLLLRNPKVLGYNIDCKGDCMAQCTRCWVRF